MSWRRRRGQHGAGILIALLAALAAVVALAIGGPAGAGAAAGYYETHVQAVDPGHSLDAVSCIPGTSSCVVADDAGEAFWATDASAGAPAAWQAWGGPGHALAEAASCPSDSYCAIAAGEVEGGGGNLYYATALGGAFGTAILPTNGVLGVSCPTSSFCVTAQEGGFVGWSATPATSRWRFEILGPGAMTGVSCPTSSFCAVVDDSGHVHVATSEEDVEEETAWVTTDVDGTTPLRGIACPSDSSCLAVDRSGEVLRLAIDAAGAATASREPVAGGGLTSVGCAGATCAAADGEGGIFASTDAGADWRTRHGGGAAVTSVSCASAAPCAAATADGDVVTPRPGDDGAAARDHHRLAAGGPGGRPYEAAPAATGGEPPYLWSAAGLPPGLAIDPAGGRISGTPMSAVCVHAPCPQPPGAYAPTVTVTDRDGTEATMPFALDPAGSAVTLTVEEAGAGSGKVDSSPAGIRACGGRGGVCRASFEDGTVVALTAGADAGSTFRGWSGGGCAGTGTCRVALGGDTRVTATFAKSRSPSPPRPPSGGNGGGKATRIPAHLRITRLRERRPGRRCHRRCATPTLAVAGKLAKRARGTVRVEVVARLHGHRARVAGRTRIAAGRWQLRLRIPFARRHPRAALRVTARFAGSPGVRAGRAGRRLRLRGRSDHSRPSRSVKRMTCPVVAGPAPMPIVGTSSSATPPGTGWPSIVSACRWLSFVLVK